jgi:hypothetical protein
MEDGERMRRPGRWGWDGTGYCHAKPNEWLVGEAARRVSELNPICCEARRC